MIPAYLPLCSVEWSAMPARTVPVGRSPKVLPTRFRDLTAILCERITAMNSHIKTRTWRESPFLRPWNVCERAIGGLLIPHLILN